MAHSGFNLGGSRVERIKIFSMQIQRNSLGDYKSLFKELNSVSISFYVKPLFFFFFGGCQASLARRRKIKEKLLKGSGRIIGF